MEELLPTLLRTQMLCTAPAPCAFYEPSLCGVPDALADLSAALHCTYIAPNLARNKRCVRARSLSTSRASPKSCLSVGNLRPPSLLAQS